ncbi:hypothetical protein EV360DRAFT_75284 [Lentinula raphanica]|nr:hypothetical protein EV360DRAFT_75284 [Lentinula raphanica]
MHDACSTAIGLDGKKLVWPISIGDVALQSLACPQTQCNLSNIAGRRKHEEKDVRGVAESTIGARRTEDTKRVPKPRFTTARTFGIKRGSNVLPKSDCQIGELRLVGSSRLDTRLDLYLNIENDDRTEAGSILIPIVVDYSNLSGLQPFFAQLTTFKKIRHFWLSGTNALQIPDIERRSRRYHLVQTQSNQRSPFYTTSLPDLNADEISAIESEGLKVHKRFFMKHVFSD